MTPFPLTHKQDTATIQGGHNRLKAETCRALLKLQLLQDQSELRGEQKDLRRTSTDGTV